MGVVLAMLPTSNAVLFTSTGDPTYNTNAPSGAFSGSGWQYEGIWGNFLGTPIAPTFFLAAKHVGGAVGQEFTLNGFTYHTTAFFDDPDTDLRVWQVAERFVSYAPLYTKSDEAGKLCVVIGRGTDRGSAVVVNKAINGWQWGSTNSIERWGENIITMASTNDGIGPVLEANFDRKGVPNECTLSVGDSSGGMFIEDGTTWKLAGIHFGVAGPFSLNGTTNTQFEAAMMDLRGLYFLSAPNTWMLIPSNYPVPVPTSFSSSRVSANISWINSIIGFQPGNELQITSSPVATNAWGTIGDIAVVKPGDEVGFSLGSSSADENPITCAWNFGDGGSTTDCNPSHVFTNCGAYAVSVTITDGVNSVSTGLTVAVACPLDISSLKLQAKFSRVGSDTCAVSGTLPNLPASFSIANAIVTLDVGDAAVTFQLSAKGRGANANGNFKLAFDARSAIWTFSGKLKGALNGSWARYGVIDSVVINSPVSVPVLLLLQSDTWVAGGFQPMLNYTDKTGPSGTATYAP